MVQRLCQGTHPSQFNMGLFTPPAFFHPSELDKWNKTAPAVPMVAQDWCGHLGFPAALEEGKLPQGTCICSSQSRSLPSSRARSGLPAEPAAKEILSVCKGSWAAAAYGKYEAKTSRVEEFIVQHDFSRCCINFKHLPFSTRVLLLCIKLALGVIYLLGRRRGLPLS